jgi:adenine deaminase
VTDEIRPDLDDRRFVAELPKVELHVHVEGTIEPGTLFEIAGRNGIELPYDTPEGVAAFQAERRSEGRENLVSFLECLDISRSALRTAADWHTITVDFLDRCHREGVRHVEVMFDPQQAIRQGVALEDCVDAITQGRRDAERDHGLRSMAIMCFQRDHSPEEAVRLIAAADSRRADIVGIGLDNYETPGFPALFRDLYDEARKRDYRLTSHCDVNQPDSVDHIRRCIEDLGVERIDHGLNVVDDPALVDLVLERNVTLAACPTFYAGQTASPPFRLGMHRTLLDAGVRVCLNTDDPAQFGSGFMTDTVAAAMAAGPFTRAEIVRFTRHAIDGAWIDDDHRAELTAALDGFVGAAAT